ncbi:PIN domain-containing protein [Methylovulum psychrotolerans]|uniref:hypothetical protein n=1 Tax=Methylovulum psychrotolerans TaxID=1704499 RepID=UPI0018E00FF1|nr:hypothetical protein [Methylovulum psychrotolerans]
MPLINVATINPPVIPADLYLSVITIGEVERGITQQQRMNPAFAEDLRRWLDTILQRYEQRLLPLYFKRSSFRLLERGHLDRNWRAGCPRSLPLKTENLTV